jgi:hypothetical protein
MALVNFILTFEMDNDYFNKLCNDFNFEGWYYGYRTVCVFYLW